MRFLHVRRGDNCERSSTGRDKISFKINHAVRRLGTMMSLGSLPTFLIIGAQRCGTTSLYDSLTGHPSILPALRKELHYFDNNYDKCLEWYKAFFPLRLPRETNSTANPPLRGEATPYYIFHPRAHQRIADVLPNAKLIVVLRNPVDRAYSHYWHEVRMGYEHLSFEEAIAKESERTGREVHDLLRDEQYRSVEHQHFSYLNRGIYHQQLRR